MSQVKEAEQLRSRLEELTFAWVLVFDLDTDDETVYSLEMPNERRHVVVAFEDRDEAMLYAESIDGEVEDTNTLASVQALDLEALVVSSREADFRVAVVFKGDLQESNLLSASALITSGLAEPLNVSYTMVPEDMYADKTTDDFLDPAEDAVWVLIHDEGTGDAHYFSMDVNGTSSVLCFKDENAALTCSSALRKKGVVTTSARSVFLEEMFDCLDETDSELDVCLIDEVLEMLDDDDLFGHKQVPATTAPSIETRQMLDRIFDAPSSHDGVADGGADGSVDASADGGAGGGVPLNRLSVWTFWKLKLPGEGGASGGGGVPGAAR